MRPSLGEWISAACLCALVGCSPLEIAAVGGTVPAPEPTYLVQVLDVRPDTAHLLVVMRADLDPLDSRPVREAIPESVLESFRAVAASYGAERLILEDSRVGDRRRAYGTGVSLTRSSHLGLVSPKCEGLATVEVRAVVTRRATRCLAELAAKRRGLSATVRVRYQIDPFGSLMHAAALPDSSRDSQAQACVVDALATGSFPRAPSLFCVDELEVQAP